MAKFKSTAHHAVRVVHYNPRVAWIRRGLVGVTLATAILGAAGGGWFIGQDRQLAMMSEHSGMQNTIAQQKAELDDLRHQVAVLSRGNLVERQASEAARREMRVMNEKIYGLEKEITFYRNIMSPGAGADKLSIQRLELAGRAERGPVHFKLVLTQVTERREQIKGSVKLQVIGEQGGAPRTLSAAELGATGDIQFSFRYFQELEGEFALPEGFQPQSVRVTARSTGRKPVEVEREFTWLVQEVGANVRQG